MRKTLHQKDLDFFQTPNELNCYWAGFIAADGNIQPSKNTVCVVLAAKDKCHLEKLAKDIQYTGSVKDTITKLNNKSYPGARLSICGASNIIHDLELNFNIIANKSLTLQSPQHLSRRLSLAFIIGYFDGDGSTGVYKSTGRRMVFLGTYDMLSWIKVIFDEEFPQHVYKNLPTVRKHKGIYEYGVCGKRAEYIMSKLREIDVPRLGRKWAR